MTRKAWVVFLVFAVSALAQKVTGPLPVTGDSHPFLAAGQNLRPLDLSQIGYVEEEFLVSGTANVYDYAADGALTVKTADAPYTTRILVRRPADASRFNGAVVVELPNTARRFDWTMLWGYVHNYVTDSGAAWVGITMPGAVQGLKKFNPARYAALAFSNPTPDAACAAGPGRGARGGNATSPDEDGLRFDAITQVGALLKSGNLPGLRAQRVYLTTQGGDAVTYAEAVQPRAKVYDGFVIKSPGGPSRISRCASAPPQDAANYLRNVGVPVIGVLTQGEVLASQPYLRADSDDPADRVRIYEIAGAAHIDAAPYIALPSVADQNAAGGAQGTPDWPFAARCEPEIALQQLPLQAYVLNAAFAALDEWVKKGTPAPKAGRMEIAGAGTPDAKIALDRFGNGLGGLRSPYVDVPTATYFTTTPGPGTCRELGFETRFDWARVDALYGSFRNYAAKVTQFVDRMTKERFLTEADARRMKAELLPAAR